MFCPPLMRGLLSDENVEQKEGNLNVTEISFSEHGKWYCQLGGVFEPYATIIS
ncbi:hypothetical protein KSF_105110 [Reticulibacter mediterranei]|uniref:Uncharacterized protein n=1 Tax=Reticulibacter mediterranei TaxID=2778369 RepID=A0A8J3N979_9CHLR|nr:hypothetical protein KSF_105110 [Reticulibacter mediterranei]